jgi:arginine repressor
LSFCAELNHQLSVICKARSVEIKKALHNEQHKPRSAQPHFFAGYIVVVANTSKVLVVSTPAGHAQSKNPGKDSFRIREHSRPYFQAFR